MYTLNDLICPSAAHDITAHVYQLSEVGSMLLVAALSSPAHLFRMIFVLERLILRFTSLHTLVRLFKFFQTVWHWHCIFSKMKAVECITFCHWHDHVEDGCKYGGGGWNSLCHTPLSTAHFLVASLTFLLSVEAPSPSLTTTALYFLSTDLPLSLVFSETRIRRTWSRTCISTRAHVRTHNFPFKGNELLFQ